MRTVIPLSRYLLALLLFNLAACSTMQPVAVPDGPYAPNSVQVGSMVELVTVEGVEHRFTVKEVTGQGIGGSAGFFHYSEIESLQVQVPGEGRTVLGVIAVAALVALFYAGVNEAAKVSLSPGR